MASEELQLSHMLRSFLVAFLERRSDAFVDFRKALP